VLEYADERLRENPEKSAEKLGIGWNLGKGVETAKGNPR